MDEALELKQASLRMGNHEDRTILRLRLIENVLDPDLTDEERHIVIAGLVENGIALADGEVFQVSRATLYRYLRAFQTGGVSSLSPKTRKDAGRSRALPDRILEQAVQLRHIQKERDTTRLIKRLEQLFPAYLGKIKRSTLDRHLALANASRRQLGVLEMKVRRRFEAPEPNDLWTGDALHAQACLRVHVPGGSGLRKIYLISWIDDHSRFIPHSEWYLVERLPSLEDCFKKAVLAYGLPRRVYSDKGAIYEARMWILAVAELKIHKVQTRARNPEAHGKIEKWHQFVRDFEQEASAAGLNTLADVNAAWWAYLRVMYQGVPHSETGECPSVRYDRLTNRRFPDAQRLSRLFLIRETRDVDVKFSTISVRGQNFRVDPFLRGRKVEVRYDPYALDRVYIWRKDREAQVAYPAKSDNLPLPPPPVETTGPTPAKRQDARAFLRGIIEESETLQRQALPGLHLAGAASPSSQAYNWTTFTHHLAAALVRDFETFTEAERTAAYQLWHDHGPLNRQWVQAALTRALASKGNGQHLSYYLDQIKLVHFDEAVSDGDSQPPVAGRQKSRPNPKGDPDAGSL